MIYIYRNLNTIKKLLSKKGIVINNDWHGKKLPFKTKFYLGIVKEKLIFATKIYHPPNYNKKQKYFTEGLWHKDVVELFISSRNKKSYLEINIAPNSSYWIQGFTKYRKRNETFVIPKSIKTSGILRKNFWSTAIAIDLKQLKLNHRTLNKWELNITGIIGKNRRYYFSYNKLKLKQADFHKRKLLQPIKTYN